MRLNPKAMALTIGILWAGALLITGIANSIWSGYGTTFLQVVASIYPGYQAKGSMGDLIVGTLYALVDGAVGGWVFAWLYNLFLGKRAKA
jgi:ABC-type phosphate transport system permease subunit